MDSSNEIDVRYDDESELVSMSFPDGNTYSMSKEDANALHLALFVVSNDEARERARKDGLV